MHTQNLGRTRTRPLLALGVTGIALCLTGCIAPDQPRGAAPRPAPTASAPATGPTEFSRDLSPEQAITLFDTVAHAVITATTNPKAEDFTAALTEAGATQASLETSSNITTQGDTTDAIFWALNLNDQCLIGQFHPKEADPTKVRYFSSTGSPIDGGCLLGTHR